MSKVRVLVGTRKGAFTLTSDGKRDNWQVSGPHFAGWEIYHLKGSPVDPNRLYASQTSGWFGQTMQRSNDGGATWEPVGNKFIYDGVPGTHQWYDGTPHPWEFKRVWHLEPSLTDPDKVYAGAEDAALFESTDGGATWTRVARKGTECFGATVHPRKPNWVYLSITESAPDAGLWLSKDGGKNWTALEGLPFRNAQRVTFDPNDDSIIYVSTFGGSVWKGPAEP